MVAPPAAYYQQEEKQMVEEKKMMQEDESKYSDPVNDESPNDTTSNSIYAYLPHIGIAIAGIAVGIVGMMYWQSDNYLVKSNRLLNQDILNLRLEGDKLRDELKVYKKIDLRNRDGTIKALETINEKYESKLNDATKQVSQLKQGLNSSKDRIKKLYQQVISSQTSYWSMFIRTGIPWIALILIATDPNDRLNVNQNTKDAAVGFMAVAVSLATATWVANGIRRRIFGSGNANPPSE